MAAGYRSRMGSRAVRRLCLAVGACYRRHENPQARRTLALPKRCVRVLREHQARQAGQLTRAGAQRQDHGLVFTTATGKALDKDTARRAFRKVVSAAGLDPGEWVPRETRQPFVSVLSDDGMAIETISDLVGHKDQTTTETVYRHQIRPVVQHGAEAMDRIFPER
jgi:site-specific recombinase XerD